MVIVGYCGGAAVLRSWWLGQWHGRCSAFRARRAPGTRRKLCLAFAWLRAPLPLQEHPSARLTLPCRYLAGQGIARQRQAIISGLRESVQNFKDEVRGAKSRLAAPVAAVVKVHWGSLTKMPL